MEPSQQQSQTTTTPVPKDDQSKQSTYADKIESPNARINRQSTMIGQRKVGAAASQFKRSNTKSVSQTKKGKKNGANAKQQPEGFSLLPLHEQMAAANAPSSSEEVSEDYAVSDGDESNDSYWFTSSDEDEEEMDADDIAWKNSRMVMYAQYTHYDVIKEVAKFNFDYHLTKRQFSKWDIAWFDGPITMKFLQRMQPWQRTNHLPGIYNLAKKNMLGRHLMRLQSVFPEDYNFFPPTFNLPDDFKEFVAQIGKKRNKTFIVKPEASCQGKGIFLTRDPETLTTEKTIHTTNHGVVEHMVVQRYMHKPYLIDGFKFDLRIYVLVNGISPLRVYVYKDGLARFATVPYHSPAPSNLKNLCMHLTNYAINKESSDFVQNEDGKADDVGSKRSYQFILRKLTEDYGLLTKQRVQDEINDIIVKTMCLAQPHVHHLYRSCQPDDIENSQCFQILGFDIMIDSKLKASLIEVNQMPSFATDSPLDYKIKQGVINDAIALMNLSTKRRNRTKKEKKAELQRRLLKGYSHKLSSAKDDVNPSGGTNVDKKDETKDIASSEAVSSPDKISSIKEANSTTLQPTGLNKTASKANLGVQKKETQAAKKNIRQLALQSKQELLIRKRILREKAEEALCGGYELIYPQVTYAEEEKIKEKITVLKSQGHKGASVQSYIGLDAPKTLKEKLAEMHEAKDQPGGGKSNKTPVIVRKESKESLDDSDTQAPQLGDNTIEFAAIEKLMEEQAERIRGEEDPNQQQGQNDGDTLSINDPLDKRWLKQIKYENFIECTRRMWDQFTTSASLNKQKRLNAKAEKKEKEDATKEKKDKARKDQARKNLYVKLKQQAEERKQRQEERQRALNGIQEEQNRSNSSRDSQEKDMLFPGDKKHEFGKGEQKLNMAELVEQHRKLTNQIAVSQQKFLEDGLRRNRKNSSQLDVNKSYSTSNNQNDDEIIRKSSQKKKGVPNTNYFAHIIQQQKQNSLEKNSQQHQFQNQQKNQSNMEDHGIMIKSIEGLPKKRDLSPQKLSFQSSAHKGERKFLADSNHDLVEVAPNVSNHGGRSSAKSNKASADVEKFKSQAGGEFPLDHILPVFNLNKKEAPVDKANFIPTLKFKQKDINLNNKAKRGLVKGSTVNRKVEQAPLNSSGVIQHVNPSQVFAGQNGAQQKQSIGSAAFRERSQSHALAEKHHNAAQEQISPVTGSRPVQGVGFLSGVGAPPNRYTDHVLQPTTDMAIMDNFSGSHMMFQNSISANNEDSVHLNKNQERKSILDQVQPILQEKSYRKNPQQFKTLEPIVQQKIQNQQKLPSQAQLPLSDLIPSNGKLTYEQQLLNQNKMFDSLMAQQQQQQMRQPNVIMIGLDLDGKPSRALDLKNTLTKESNSMIRNYKSPQVDQNRKYSQRRDQFENMLNPMHSKQGPGTQQQTSGKANSLYENISVQKQPYQRNSKLQEMFGDVQKKHPIPNYHSNVKSYPMSDHTASTQQNEQNIMAMKYMENIFGPVPKDNIVGSGIVKKPSSSTNKTQQIQNNRDQQFQSQRAILPEISDQHKSKEVTRAVQNKSQMINQNMPSDLSMSFQKNTFTDSKNNSAHGGGDTNSNTNRMVKKRRSSNFRNDLMLMQGVEGQSFNPEQSKNMQYQNKAHQNRRSDYNNQSPGDSFEQNEETTHFQNSSAASRFGRNTSVLSGDAIRENNISSAQQQKSLFRSYMQNDPPFFPGTQNRNSSLPGGAGSQAQEVILNGVNLRQQAETQEKKAQSGTINLGTQDNANAYFSLFNSKQAPQ